VLAGGAVATHVLEQSPAHHRHHAPRSAAAAPGPAASGGRLLSAAPAGSLSTSSHRSVRASRRPLHASPRRALGSTRRASTSTAGQREPGGFAYLGVPTETAGARSEPAHVASTSEGQSGGGPFTP
jgi:hypothetical protein